MLGSKKLLGQDYECEQPSNMIYKLKGLPKRLTNLVFYWPKLQSGTSHHITNSQERRYFFSNISKNFYKPLKVIFIMTNWAENDQLARQELLILPCLEYHFLLNKCKLMGRHFNFNYLLSATFYISSQAEIIQKTLIELPLCYGFAFCVKIGHT